jgi:hypothetical protein
VTTIIPGDQDFVSIQQREEMLTALQHLNQARKVRPATPTPTSRDESRESVALTSFGLRIA